MDRSFSFECEKNSTKLHNRYVNTYDLSKVVNLLCLLKLISMINNVLIKWM